MRLFDPARPTSDGIALYAPTGVALGRSYGLPVLTVQPGERDGQWSVSILMPTSANAFAHFATHLATTSELANLFVRWLADPEDVIARDFAYTYDAKTLKTAWRSRRIARDVAAGLAELGLTEDETT